MITLKSNHSKFIIKKITDYSILLKGKVDKIGTNLKLQMNLLR